MIDENEKAKQVYLSKQQDLQTRRESQVFQAIQSREKSLISIQKIVHSLHTRHASFLRKEVEKPFSLTDVIELINALLMLRMQTLHVSTKLREWQHGVHVLNKNNRSPKPKSTQAAKEPKQTLLDSVFLWRGIDYSYKICYDLAATIAALPRPLENWIEKYVPLVDNPLLLKDKLNAPNVPPKRPPKRFSFVLEHANKSPIRRHQKKKRDEALQSGIQHDYSRPYIFPFDPSDYVASNISSSEGVVSSAIAWPDDECQEVPLELKIQAARSLAGLCTKVSQAKSRLEQKYSFVNSSSSFIVPNSSSIVSKTRDLNKPLSPSSSMNVFSKRHEIDLLLSKDDPESESSSYVTETTKSSIEASVHIEDHADSMAGLSSAFLSVTSFDDMKNVYQLETAVAKLIDVDHDGKHWGNEIRRAQHFFQEELYRHWLKQEAKRIKDTKLFAANFCKRSIMHAMAGAHMLIMDKKTVCGQSDKFKERFVSASSGNRN